MWEALGGTTVHAGCLSFVQLFRPAWLALHRLGRSSWSRPLDRVLRPTGRRSARLPTDSSSPDAPAVVECASERLTPEVLVEHCPRSRRESGSCRLRRPLPHLALRGARRFGPPRAALAGGHRAWATLGGAGDAAGTRRRLVRLPTPRGGFLPRSFSSPPPERKAEIVFASSPRARENGAAGIYGGWSHARRPAVGAAHTAAPRSGTPVRLGARRSNRGCDRARRAHC